VGGAGGDAVIGRVDRGDAPADEYRSNRVRTLEVSNANRHVGLALLLSGQYIHNRDALPTVACYAIVVAVMMMIAPKIFKQRDELRGQPRRSESL